jgi:pimeloyl-ACP methyl ester carboxylesterase
LPQFAADGCTLHYETSGSGEPVVLLHGFTSLGSSWLRHGWIDALAGFRVITLDLPAHGESEAIEDTSTPHLASLVVALLDEVGVERAAVVGFSFGGGVALQVAADAPDHVTRLVVGGVGDAALQPADVRAIERMRRDAELAGSDLEPLMPYLRDGWWPGSPVGLRPLPMPALVILAEADEYMWPAEELLRRLRPTNVLRLPDRGHHQVVPNDDVKEAVAEFLAELRG